MFDSKLPSGIFMGIFAFLTVERRFILIIFCGFVQISSHCSSTFTVATHVSQSSHSQIKIDATESTLMNKYHHFRKLSMVVLYSFRKCYKIKREVVGVKHHWSTLFDWIAHTTPIETKWTFKVTEFTLKRGETRLSGNDYEYLTPVAKVIDFIDTSVVNNICYLK